MKCNICIRHDALQKTIYTKLDLGLDLYDKRYGKPWRGNRGETN